MQGLRTHFRGVSFCPKSKKNPLGLFKEGDYFGVEDELYGTRESFFFMSKLLLETLRGRLS